MKSAYLLLIIGVFLCACSQRNHKSDAYGNFEAVETIVSAEAQGTLQAFGLEEGQMLKKGQYIGFVDTVQLHLKKLQAYAQIRSARTKLDNINSQIKVQEEQKKNLIIEKDRVSKLLAGNAVPEKQRDDVDGNLTVIESQIVATASQRVNVKAEIDLIRRQVEQIDDQIRRAVLYSPITGSVLEKYAEPFEIITPGKPLYKIAPLDTLILRVYISGDQLPFLAINQNVTVLIDESKSENRSLKGRVAWVSPQAEFTPKTIQTKKERVNLVYAVKVMVPNDGSLKIGMPGEINFMKKENE